MKFETIIYEKGADGIATITMNRPQVMNAQNPLMIQERRTAVDDAKADDSVRVLIITGSGRSFCAGDDVREMWLDPSRKDRTQGGRLNELKDLPRQDRYLHRFWKPCIAAINGPAVGAGLEVALEADIRISNEKGQVGWFFVRRNLQGTQWPAGIMRILYMMGLGRAMEFVLSGEMLNADEALKVGLVDKVVTGDNDKLMAEARAMAKKLMQGAPLAQLAVKQMVHAAMFDPQSLVALSNALGSTLRNTEDHYEAAHAFMEKRPANFKMR